MIDTEKINIVKTDEPSLMNGSLRTDLPVSHNLRLFHSHLDK